MTDEEKTCFYRKYEYIFTYDGETYKTDYCSTTFRGVTTCKKDGITYNNVQYKSIYIGCNDYLMEQKRKELPINIMNIVLLFFISVILCHICSKLFNYMNWK